MNPPRRAAATLISDNLGDQIADSRGAVLRDQDPLVETINQGLGLKWPNEFCGFVGHSFETFSGPSSDCLHNPRADLDRDKPNTNKVGLNDEANYQEAVEQEHGREETTKTRKAIKQFLEDIPLESNLKSKGGQLKRNTREATKKKSPAPEETSQYSIEALNDSQIINRNCLICGATDQDTAEHPTFTAKQIWGFHS
ncbi:hypothetical protein Ancab_033594 [Ancistrocladus abbreviatus]